MEKIIKKQIIVLCIFASLFLMGGGGSRLPGPGTHPKFL